MIYYLLAAAAGFAGVLQSGLNKKIAEKTGLAFTLNFGNFVVLLAGAILLSVVPAIYHGEFARLVKFKIRGDLFQWWYVVPGLLGLFFIVTAPFAITKIGALKVFVGIICAQTIGSFMWDLWIEKLPVDSWRIAACGLTLLGAGAMAMSKS